MGLVRSFLLARYRDCPLGSRCAERADVGIRFQALITPTTSNRENGFAEDLAEGTSAHYSKLSRVIHAL